MRHIEPIETAPALELTPHALDTLIDERRAQHAIYSPVFQRREQREWSERYMHGWRRELPRKAIEPMVLALEGPHRKAVRAMPPFRRESAWDDEAMWARHGPEVERALGDDDGVRLLDGRALPTQGTQSVGVKRPDCGDLGQRANCPAGVFLGYASRHGATLLDRRWQLPQEGLEAEAYAERRAACGVPAAVGCTTKLVRGWAMSQAVHPAGSRRCRGVACDEACGRDTTRLDQIAGLGWWYDAEVPHDTRGWLERPATAGPAWSGRGRKPRHAQGVAGTVAPQAMAALAAAVPASAWSQQTIKEGSQGPLVAAFATLRGMSVREGLPGPQGWLSWRRHVHTGALQTSRRNAPPDTPLTTLVRMRGRRWPIETCWEDGKQYLGLGDEAVRAWRGWQHHLTLCMREHCFLVRLQCRLKKKPRPCPGPRCICWSVG